MGATTQGSAGFKSPRWNAGCEDANVQFLVPNCPCPRLNTSIEITLAGWWLWGGGGGAVFFKVAERMASIYVAQQWLFSAAERNLSIYVAQQCIVNGMRN